MTEPHDTTLKLLVFAGSSRVASLNYKLASLAARVAAANGAVVDLAALHDFDVPAYDGDDEAEDGIPTGAQALRQRLLANDASLVRKISPNTTPRCRAR